MVVAADMAAFDDGIGNRNTTDGHGGRLWRFCRWGQNIRMGTQGARETNARRYRMKLDV